jgi:predicted esterase
LQRGSAQVEIVAMILARPSAVVLALIAASVLAGQQPATRPAATGAKLVASDAKRLVVEAFGADAKKSAAARAQLTAARPEDRKLICDALGQIPFRPPAKAPPSTATITLDLVDCPVKKGTAIVELPSKYDGKTLFPLVFRFHGSGDTAAEYARNTPDPSFKNVITVTPEIPSADRMGWNQPGGFQLVDAVYRHMLQNYAVDPERVYLSGHSAGGAASFMLSQTWPHRFAAFFAMARLYWKFHPMPEPCMDVLKQVPGFFVVGLADTDERVAGFRTAEAYYKKTSLPGEFRFIAGQGHTYIRDQASQAFEFLLKKKRPKIPKDFCAIFYRYSSFLASEYPLHDRQYWLEGGKFDPNGTSCHVTVAGNVIDIAGPKLESGAVLLNDDLVNLDQPVTIRLNGKTVHEKPVERSVEFLLDWYAKERDRGQLYWNRLAF